MKVTAQYEPRCTLYRVAAGAWINNMPVSFAVQECINQSFNRIYLKRYIETLYHTWDVEYDTFFNYD